MNREAEDRFFDAARSAAIDAEDEELAAKEEAAAAKVQEQTDIKPSRPSITGR